MPIPKTILTSESMHCLHDVAAADSARLANEFWQCYFSRQFLIEDGWIVQFRGLAESSEHRDVGCLTRENCTAVIIWFAVNTRQSQQEIERMLCNRQMISWSDEYDTSEVYLIFTKKMEFVAAKIPSEQVKLKRHTDPELAEFVSLEPLHSTIGKLEFMDPEEPSDWGIQQDVDHMKERLMAATADEDASSSV